MCICHTTMVCHTMRYHPDGWLTSGREKHDVELESLSHSYKEEFTSEDNVFIITKAEELNTMNTGEDESSPGLNGRLRPRKSTITTPSSHKSTRKPEGKLAEDRPNKSNQSKASPAPTKEDDLTAKSDISPASSFLCSYCDKKFTSKQAASKHARRIHLFNSKQDNFIKCLYCTHSEAESNHIIKHMVDNHPNQYFACLDCYTRFSGTAELAEHKHNICEKQKPSYRSKLRQKSGRTRRNTKRSNNAYEKSAIQNENPECSDEHMYNGIVISCELKPSQTHDAADIEDNLTTNVILPPTKSLGKSVMEKNAVIVLDDIQWNKRMPPNFSFHNTDADQILSRLGVVHRSPRVGESTKKEWIKIVDESTQKFERCFDTNFYSKVAKNVQENLTKFLDGTFNFNPNKENTIKTRKSKTGVVINTAEGFPILLAYEQYSRNLLEGYMPRALAPKHKWKWDSAETDKNVVMHMDNSKRDSHVNNCIITLVSSLDIWTQLQMKRKFEDIYKITPTAKKTEKQNIISRELKEILESRDIPSNSTQVVKYQRSSEAVVHSTELPAQLGLKPAMPLCEFKPALLSGEWVRPRCYVCCACGDQTNDARTLSTHISSQHPNAQVQHYEIVGDTLLRADILKHLYVPPSQMSNRTRPPRGFRDCTKCKKSIIFEDLHQHMLDCAGDTPTVRRKCRYRPFGVRRRRPRLPDNTTIRKKIRKDIRSRHRQKCHLRARPRIRTEVGDAETIRKMIADLPAKRNRISVPISRPRRNILNVKKTIKLRSSEETKTAKFRAAKSITRLKKATALKKQQLEVDNSSYIDEDDQPLKLSSKLDSSRQIRRANSGKKEDSEGPKNHNDCVDLTNTLPLQDDHHKVEVYGAGPSNVRQHSNCGNSSNQESCDQRPTGEKNKETEENNTTSAPTLPFNQCINSLTSSAESPQLNLLPYDRHIVQGQRKNLVSYMVSDDHQTFENESVAEKFDKPPLWKEGSESGLSKERSKLSKNKKGLEHCIAMLRTKKGLPESNKIDKPVNTISQEETFQSKSLELSTISSVLIGQSLSDQSYSNSDSAEQPSSDIHVESKPQTVNNEGLLAVVDIHHRKSSVDSKSVSPMIKQDELTMVDSSFCRSSSLSRHSEISGNRPFELTPWVPILPIAGETYTDFSVMRRNSYDPALTAGHTLYQNTANAVSLMNVPHMNVLPNTHFLRNPDGNMAWHHIPPYRPDLYGHLLTADPTGTRFLSPQYTTGEHDQTNTSLATPRRRRDPNRKEIIPERKQKVSPNSRHNSMPSSHEDAVRQTRVSPEGLNAYVARHTYPPATSAEMPMPDPPTRVRRDSSKRKKTTLESAVNLSRNSEEGLPSKVPRNSPRPHPEPSNLRRHSMDIGATSSTVGSHDANLLQVQHGSYIGNSVNISPHSRRGRSETRTITPDECRYFDDRLRQDITHEVHTRHVVNLMTSRNEVPVHSNTAVHNNQRSRYISNAEHTQQQQQLQQQEQQQLHQQDAMPSRPQNDDYHNDIPNVTSINQTQSADNLAQRYVQGAQGISINNEMQSYPPNPLQNNELHKHAQRKTSIDGTVHSNVYKLTNQTDMISHSQQLPSQDFQSNKKNGVPQTNPVCYKNHSSLEMTGPTSSGTYSPPDLRTRPVNVHEINKRRVSESLTAQEDSSLLLSHHHTTHRSEFVYPYRADTNVSDMVRSQETSVDQPDIPLDLSRSATTKYVTDPYKQYSEMCINYEKHPVDSSVNYISFCDEEALNLASNNKSNLSENRTMDSIQPVPVRNDNKPFKNGKTLNPDTKNYIHGTKNKLEPSNLVSVGEPEIMNSSSNIFIGNEIIESVHDRLDDVHPSSKQGNLEGTKEPYPPYYHKQICAYDAKGSPNQVSDSFLSLNRDYCQTSPISGANNRRSQETLQTNSVASWDIRNTKILLQNQLLEECKREQVQEKYTSNIDTFNLNINKKDRIEVVTIESDDEDNNHIARQKQYEGNKVEGNQILQKNRFHATDFRVTNTDNDKVSTEKNKGLDPATFANLEELMAINQAQSKINKNDADENNSNYDLKNVHRCLANVLERMNEVQIKNMLDISPTLTAKIKSAALNVNASASSSLTQDSAVNACDNLSVAICSSSILPKKRFSPSQPVLRLNSSEFKSASPDMQTINIANSLQMSPLITSKHSLINSDICLQINNSPDNISSQHQEGVPGSDIFENNSGQKPDIEYDNEINVVDSPEPDLFRNTDKDLQTQPSTIFSPTTFAESLAIKTATTFKNPEQTASLRAVRIKPTPLSRKYGYEDKNVTVTSKSLQIINVSDEENNESSMNKIDISQPYFIPSKMTHNDSDALISQVTTENLLINDNLDQDKNPLMLPSVKPFCEQDISSIKNSLDSTHLDNKTKSGNINEKTDESNPVIQPLLSSAQNVMLQNAHKDTPAKDVLVLNKYLTKDVVPTEDVIKDVDIIDPIKTIDSFKDKCDDKISIVASDQNQSPALPTTEPGKKESSMIDQNNTDTIVSNIAIVTDTDFIENSKPLQEISKSLSNKDYKARAKTVVNASTMKDHPLLKTTAGHSLSNPTEHESSSLSPKIKKSDGEDSEDDVSLADILKKRNVAKSALTVESETNDECTRLLPKGTISHAVVASSEEINSCTSVVPKSIHEGESIACNSTNTANLLNSYISTNDIDKLVDDKSVIMNKPASHHKIDTLDNEIHETNIITFANEPLNNTNKNDYNKDDNKDNLNSIATSKRESYSHKDDVKPEEEKSDMFLEARSIKNSRETTSMTEVSFAKDLQSINKISNADSVPLRRSRRGKSTCIDISSVEDEYDFDALIDNMEESKKLPLTMKRLILSRVEKDKSESLAEPSNVHELNIINKDSGDNIVLSKYDAENKTSLKKVQPIKRKQTPHTRRKTKKCRSYSQKSNGDSKYESNPDMNIFLADLSNSTNHESQTSSKDLKNYTVPESSTYLTEHESLVTDDKNNDEVTNSKLISNLSGKRKKNNRSGQARSKKAKYSKAKTCSDFDSEDEKGLTEIKQNSDFDSEDEKGLTEIKQKSTSANEFLSEIVSNTLFIDKKKDAYEVGSEINSVDESDIASTVNANIAVETRTTCYSRSILNKKLLSASSSKNEFINYDPYDIDLEDMIESTGPAIKKKGKSTSKACTESTLKVKAAHKKTTLKKNNDKPVFINDSDSDSSKSDVPLQKYVNDKLTTADKIVLENKLNDSEYKTSEITHETNEAMDNYEDGTGNSVDKEHYLNNKKRDNNDETTTEISASNLDQNSNMSNNNNSSEEPKPKQPIKEKKNRRTLAVYNDVDQSINEVDQQLRSDKFMESFGFYSEKIPRKSNLLATKKISQYLIGNESNDSLLGYKESKNRKSNPGEKNSDSSEHIVEDATSYASAGNEQSSPSRSINVDDKSVFNDQHELDRREMVDEHSQKDLSLNSKVVTETNTEENYEDIQPPISDTIENNISKEDLEKSIDNVEQEETRSVESIRKKNKGTSFKQIDKEFVLKLQMYPEVEIDLLEDKFDIIKRKRRSQAVAAKQIQTTVESSSSNKPRKQPERKKAAKIVKKKSLNSQVPTKGALKGFESIKISIPTQDLHMPPNVSPPRQQKRKRKVSKRRKTSETGSTCSEYDEKSKSFQDKDVYEFKDNEDTELLELRPSTVMDRFRSIHNNTNKNKSKDKKDKGEKHKEKGKKNEAKDKLSSKDEKEKIKSHSTKKNNGKQQSINEDEMDKEHITEVSKMIELDNINYDHINNLFGKYDDNKNATEPSAKIIGNKDMISTPDEIYPIQGHSCSNVDHTDDAVAGTSGFAPNLGDESDYESESSIAGGCIVYKSDEFNCICQSDLESEESDSDKTCGKTNCLYRNRNADKNAAIGNIFKNNAVRCDKTETKQAESAKPDLDQLFDSLLETKAANEISDNKLTSEANDLLLPIQDSRVDENGSQKDTITSDNDITDIRDTIISKSINTDDISLMACEDPVSKDDLDTPNISSKSGLYMMVSTKSTQTGVVGAQTPDDIETTITNNKNTADDDDDEFDVDKKESDEWMVFQELVRPASKGSQTELTKLLYHCDEHADCDFECQSAFNKYLVDIASNEVCVVVSTRGSQTVILEKQIHDVDAESLETIINWKLSKKKFGVTVADACMQTDLSKLKFLESPENYFDSTPVSEQYCSPPMEETEERNTEIDPNRTNNVRVASLPEGATCSFIAPFSTPSRKSDEGISTSHECSADTFDQSLDDAGVARQRARRKCTVGKQNVLAEHWSSESEAEVMPPRRNSADSVVACMGRKKRGRKKEHSVGSKRGSRQGTRRKHGGRGRASSEESVEGAGPSRRPPGPKIRAWPRHHYWSSDGEDPDPQPQHGWIVGDSHKKLVTMLAHAKGRKRNSVDKRQLDE